MTEHPLADGFSFRPCRTEDLDELVRLEHDVEQGLPSRDMFATDERDFYEAVLRGGGSILLAVNPAGQLAGASVIRFPAPDDPDNLGRELGFSPEQLARVRHLESVFIRQESRGRKLAERLLRENLSRTEARGRDIFMATVWPGNASSLNLHMGLGLFIRGFAFKYGGRPRFILMGSPKPPAFSGDPAFVPSGDIAMHRLLLEQGMAGIRILRSQEDDDFFIGYRHIASPFRC